MKHALLFVLATVLLLAVPASARAVNSVEDVRNECIRTALAHAQIIANDDSGEKTHTALEQFYSTGYEEAKSSTSGRAFFSDVFTKFGFDDQKSGKSRFEESKSLYVSDRLTWARRYLSSTTLTGQQIVDIIHACQPRVGLTLSATAVGTNVTPELILVRLHYSPHPGQPNVPLDVTVSCVGLDFYREGDRFTNAWSDTMKPGMIVFLEAKAQKKKKLDGTKEYVFSATADGISDAQVSVRFTDEVRLAVRREVLRILCPSAMQNSVDMEFNQAELEGYVCRQERTGFGGSEGYPLDVFKKVLAELDADGFIKLPANGNNGKIVYVRCDASDKVIDSVTESDASKFLEWVDTQSARGVLLDEAIKHLQAKHGDNAGGKALGWLCISEKVEFYPKGASKFAELKVRRKSM